MTRRALLLFLVVLSPLVGSVGAVAAQPGAGQHDLGASPASVTLANETTNNTTTSAESAGGPPSIASQVRITPVKVDEKFVGVTVKDAGKAYKTSGPFVFFSTSHQVEAARIMQQPAEAQVLAGGQTIKVEYKDDAAPMNKESLYTLQLFFADGSKKTIKLYATKTGVSVAAADLKKYREVIDELQEFAGQHGYGESPEALLNYLKYINDRADLVEGFMMEKAKQLFGLAIAAARNWLFWLIFLGGLALSGQWLKKRWGEMLESLLNDTGRADRKRRELDIAYEEQKQTADEERLEDVDAVGSNAVYWEDAFGTRSPAQLAALATRGAHYRDADGNLVKEHNGVEDLDVETLSSSWLDGVTRGDRIPTEKQALGEIKAVCEHLETKYNLGHLYRDTRDRCEALIDELDRREQQAPSTAPGGD